LEKKDIRQQQQGSETKIATKKWKIRLEANQNDERVLTEEECIDKSVVDKAISLEP
jgi:hypothetical protein